MIAVVEGWRDGDRDCVSGEQPSVQGQGWVANVVEYDDFAN